VLDVIIKPLGEILNGLKLAASEVSKRKDDG
jgi:hypothetical protein